jgi:transposase
MQIVKYHEKCDQQLIQLLLPATLNLKIEQIELGQGQILMHLSTSSPTACCPNCGEYSSRVHNYYRRTLTDLAWGEYEVKLRLKVRRFYCGGTQCPKLTFAERLSPDIAFYARRTNRLDEWLTALALAMGGKGGAKLARHSQVEISPSTLLRLIARQPLEQLAAPRVLGVDDFAWRKGQKYGTLLLDLETRRPLAILPVPDRETQTLSTWLAERPTIEVVSRDRNNAYAKAIRETLPHAVQVADRFHLKQSLHEAVQKVIRRLYPALQPVLQQLYTPAALVPAAGDATASSGAVQSLPTSPPPPIVREGFSRLVARPPSAKAVLTTNIENGVKAAEAEETSLSYWDKQKAVNQQNRIAVYEKVQELSGQGHTASQIARLLGIGLKRTKRLVASPEPPPPPIYKKRPHQLDPFRD